MSYRFDTMGDEQLAEFLAGPRNAVIGTIRADGSPHLTPTWYLFEGGQILVPVLKSSVKYRNLARDPRVSVCIDGGFTSLSTVMIDGSAEFVEGERERELYLRICRRYYDDAEDNERGSETFHGWGDAVVVVITPTRVRTQDYTGWE